MQIIKNMIDCGELYIRIYGKIAGMVLLMVVCYILCFYYSPFSQKKQWKVWIDRIGIGISAGLILYYTLLFRESGSEYMYELKPFWSYSHWLFSGMIEYGMEIINNMLLFLPFGFFLAEYKKRIRFSRVLLIAFLFSFCIESVQLIGRIGLFEFDDMINNTVGAGIGFLLSGVWGRRKKYKNGEID